MKNFTKLFLIMLLVGATLGLQAQYCIPPVWLTGPYTGITNVTLGTLNNSSTFNDGGAEVYTYFNAVTVPDLKQGSQYNILVSFVLNAGNENNSRVWIDWNQDTDFDDVGEQVAAWNLHPAGVENDNFTIPAGATLGTTRMRVYTDMEAGHITPTPCGYQDTLNHGIRAHGEVEDYDVNVTAAGTGIEDNNSATTAFTIIPNANGNAQIAYNLVNSANVTLDIYNVIGQKVSTVTNGVQSAGSYSYTVDNAQLSNANIYFATLKVDDTIITKKFAVR